MIPQEEHPEINFVGLLIGPRGNTLKSKYKTNLCSFFIIITILSVVSNGKRNWSENHYTG